MHALKIRVENGRIQLDEPTDVPNGTELVVVPVNELEDVVLMQDDGLDDEERQELLRSIDEGLADVDAGSVNDFKGLHRSEREREARHRRSDPARDRAHRRVVASEPCASRPLQGRAG